VSSAELEGTATEVVAGLFENAQLSPPRQQEAAALVFGAAEAAREVEEKDRSALTRVQDALISYWQPSAELSPEQLAQAGNELLRASPTTPGYDPRELQSQWVAPEQASPASPEVDPEAQAAEQQRQLEEAAAEQARAQATEQAAERANAVLAGLRADADAQGEDVMRFHEQVAQDIAATDLPEEQKARVLQSAEAAAYVAVGEIRDAAEGTESVDAAEFDDAVEAAAEFSRNRSRSVMEALEQLADAAQAWDTGAEGTPLAEQNEVLQEAYTQLGAGDAEPLFAGVPTRRRAQSPAPEPEPEPQAAADDDDERRRREQAEQTERRRQDALRQQRIEQAGRQIAEQQLAQQATATVPLHPAIASAGAVQALDASPEQRRAIDEAADDLDLDVSIASALEAAGAEADDEAIAQNIGAQLANRAQDRLAMATATDKLPKDPRVVGEFAKNTSETPMLRKLIEQGLYSPEEFAKPGGGDAARRLEAQLVFAQKKQTGARLAAEPYRPRLEPTPLVGAHKYRRPRFSYARA